jgi:hypothetical protein
MPRAPKPDALATMDREQLEAEVAALRQQLADAPSAPEPVAMKAPAPPLQDTDIAPPWQVPVELCGRNLRDDAISAYCSDGTRMRDFVPGETVRGVTVACKNNVLSILSRAADQYRLNMTNRGRVIQNAPMEFDA